MSESEPQKYLGKVKKYIPRKQFGFIVRLSDKQEFFVHRMSIRISPSVNCPYPRLYPGEYVEFTVHESSESDGKKLPNVGTVTGPEGWTLRCEDVCIQRELRQLEQQHHDSDEKQSGGEEVAAAVQHESES